MKKIGLRSLSVFLAVLMILFAFPLQVIAAELQNQTPDGDTAASGEAVTGTPIPGVDYEVTALREENVKHFHLADGSYIAVSYDVPVHYADENGDWQDIDNRLADSGSDFTTRDARVKFVKKITGNGELFTIHDGNRKLSFSLVGAVKKTAGTVEDNGDSDTGTDTLQKWMELRHLSSSIIYRDILPGTDVEYLLDAGRMKENIIVREAAAEYRYVFELKLNHLSARSNEDGSISVTDPESGETVYYLPAPVVYDAAGAYSYDAVSYTLSEENGNRLTLTLEADPAWVNAPERVFPVTVDPTINGTYSEFSDTYISEKPPKSVHGSADILRTGSTSSGGTHIIYWKQNQLPTLPKGAQVTDAKLSLYFKDSDGLINISDTELALGIYRVSEDWTESLNWYGYANNNNGKIAELQDFTVIDSLSSVGSYINWTISDLVRAWYGGTSNYGVAIKPISGTAMNLDFASSDAPGNRPRFAIQYKVVNGLEDYWSYSSHSAANAGTGHINLATGELSFVFPTVSSGENLFGYQLGLVYNQSKINGADAPIANTLTDYRLTCQETITQFKYLSESGTEKTAYIWTDGDGTAHYLLPDGSLYHDEDGLGLTLHMENTANPLKLTDKNDTWRSFSADGYLAEIRDKIGNRVVFTYTTVNGYKSVSAINIYPAGSSKAISTLNLTYESSGVLKTVKNVKNEKTSETVTFEYDGAGGTSVSLDRITYSRVTNGQTYTRVYTVEYELGRRIKNVYDSHARYGLSYTYDASGRVSEVTEIGGVKKAPGQSVGYTYGNGYTEIRTAGKDDKYGTADDLISHYTFDNQLRCVSQYTTNVDRNMIYGATRGKYEDASENRALENKLSESFVTGNTGLNYLLNGSFELGSLNYWDTYCVTLSEFPETGYFGGEYCAEVTVSNSAYLLQYVQLSKGTYTLSFNIESALPGSDPDGVTIEASYPARNGENQRVSVTKKFPEDNYYTVSFDVDTDTNGMIGLFFSKSGTDSAVFHVDNVVLEKNLGSSGNNLVSCGDFAVHTTKKHASATWTLGDFWCEADLPDFALGYSDFNRDDPTFPNYLVIEGDSGLRGEFVQAIVSNDTGSARYKGCKLLVSGFGKADHISANENSRFGLKMTVNYVANSDGTVPAPAEYYVPFDRGTSDWQFVSDVFTVPEEDGIQSITVSVVYDYQIGTAMFTDISVQLYSENANYIYAEQYKYNNNGDLIYKSDGNDRYWYFYKKVNDTPKLAISVKNAHDWLVYDYNDDGTVKSVSSYYKYVGDISYSYGEKSYSEIAGAVPSSFSDDDRQYIKEYTYNTNGQCTSEKTSTSDGVTRTSSTYVNTVGSAAYGSVSTTTDERGLVTRYFYDTATGNVTSTVAPDGTALVYTYDGYGNLTGVNTALYDATELTGTDLASVEYEYSSDNGLLSAIDTDTTRYTFSYNVFGQMEDISVGSTTLVDYILNDNNGKVSEMRYGNGASVRYVYDTLDRVSEVWYAESANADEVKAYTYAYDASGRLVRYTDHARNEQYTYLYTPTGLLYSTQISDLGEAHIYQTNWCRYDKENRIEERRNSFEFGTQGAASGLYTFTYSFGYYKQDEDHHQDEYLNAVTASADGAGKQYHESIRRDDLMRLSGKTFNLRDAGNQSAFVTNEVTYTYLDGANGSTTGLVKSYQTLINGSGTTYNLTYDVNGNITSVSLGSYVIVRYTYVDLGQMVREDNREKGYTYYYTYDKAGNILYKEAFSLMMNGEDLSDKTPVYTNVYTYGNANWGDLLTSYKGHTITYDAIGNPLTYYGRTAYTFTWKNGRQLATATANGKTLSFTYNDQGMRLTKTVDGVTHTYSLDGDRIVAEEWGNQLLVYFYDDDGLPMGMMYRNSSYADKQFDYYLYEKDVFGNILAIYNASGTKVASYCYDAWGNCTVLTNVNGIGTMNPFRYRGYYLDTETNLYYLQSRYYDSYTGRFINADGQLNGGLLGYNLFAYCENNPVMYIDPTGEFLLTALIIGAVIGAAVAFAATVYADYQDDGEVFNGSVSPVTYVMDTVAGALLGAAVGFIAPEIGAMLAGTSAIPVLVGGETIASGIEVAVAGLLGVTLVFASNGRPGDNKKQNKQFNDIMNELHIKDQSQKRRVHDQIKGQHLDYHELKEFIKAILKIK